MPLFPMKTRPNRSAGFSLVELLIALVFISFLMAGMLRIYGSSIQGFSAANESVKAQRDNRQAMERIEDDLSAAGYQFPGIPSTVSLATAAGSQDPVMILPGSSLTVMTVNPSNPSAAPTSETLTFDEFQYVTDQALPITAHLTGASAAGAISLDLAFTQGSFADLQAGDLIVMLDGQGQNTVESSVVASGLPTSGSSGTLPLQATSGGNPNSGSVTSAAGGLGYAHPQNAEIYFIRPAQVIRYTLLGLALDPANSSATVPCLVRDQKAYPPTGALISWPAATSTAAQLTAAGVTRTVVAENVTGLRFNLSADQGTTWLRGATWAATLTSLDSALATVASANPGMGYATTAEGTGSLAAWYRYAPMLFRVDITTRTVLKRADYSATANAAAYRTRTQTLFVQPRNYGLDTFLNL